MPPGPLPGFWRWNVLIDVTEADDSMTGTTRSSEGLEPRRRKLLFRSWHRGMREMDLIMGRFADSAIDQFTDDDLTEFERLIEVPDRDLLAWITGETGVPANYDTALFRRLRNFHMADGGGR
jgi:antitoxin CptB